MLGACCCDIPCGRLCVEVDPCDGTSAAGYPIEVREAAAPHDLVASGVTSSSGRWCVTLDPGDYLVTRGPKLTGPQYEETREVTIAEGCDSKMLYFAVPFQLCVAATSCGGGIEAHWEFTGGYDDQDAQMACITLDADATFPITATGTVDGVTHTYTWDAPDCPTFPPVLDFTPDTSCVLVLGCDSFGYGEFQPMEGATVTWTFPDSTTATATSDADGLACATAPDHGGELAQITVEKARYTTQYRYSVFGCETPTFAMKVAPGYWCCPGCNGPSKINWSYTDSAGTVSPTIEGATACQLAPWDGTVSATGNNTFVCTTPDPPRRTAVTVAITCSYFPDAPTTSKMFRVSIAWRGILCGEIGPIDPETGDPIIIWTPKLVQNTCAALGSNIALSAYQDFPQDDPCMDDAPVLSGSWPATVSYYDPITDATYDFPCPVSGGWVATEA